MELQQQAAIRAVLTDSISEEDMGSWILQFYVQDEPNLRLPTP